MAPFKVKQIISGGQTGIDQLGLEVAHSLGFQTGGVAQKGYLTESGPNSLLRDKYGLTEHESTKYPSRTKSNVHQSDGTVVFGEVTGGTSLTVHECKKVGKPYIINPTADVLFNWLIDNQIEVLNVAGNRASGLSFEKIQLYRQTLYEVLTTNQRLALLFRNEPVQWGLRGDPHLWTELMQVSKTLQLPVSTENLNELLLLLIRNLIGEELIHGKMIRVPRYRFGGMSSGMVSADFWLDEAIPLLKYRLVLFRNGEL